MEHANGNVGEGGTAPVSPLKRVGAFIMLVCMGIAIVLIIAALLWGAGYVGHEAYHVLSKGWNAY